MTSIHVDLDSIEWTPGSAYKRPDALYRDQEVFYRKVLQVTDPTVSRDDL